MKNKKIKTAIIATAGVVVAGIIIVIGIEQLNNTKNEIQVEKKSDYEIPKQPSFTMYEGNNEKGPQVKSLINMINQSNIESEEYVQYTGPKASEIKSTKTYTVELQYNEEGYVCEVIVTENEDGIANEIDNF